MNGTTRRSPLAEIEHRVQQRAHDISLDMSSPTALDTIRNLITDELTRWDLDHRRGLHTQPLTDPTRTADRALRNLTSYGPLTDLLDDPDVWEIMINAPDAIFVKRHQGPSGYHDDAFHDDDHVARIITKLLDDASTSHRKLDPAEGLQDAQLDNGARLHIVHRDIGRGGHLIVNIRKFTGVTFRTLHDLVERDTLNPTAATFLATTINAGASIVFAGAPGSGKTTLLTCCAAELDPSLRVVTAEEVFEADIPLANVASLQTRPARADREAVDLRRLVAGFLRMAADVAIVGEVRDREALPYLLALSSGIKGFTTIHAGSARQALTRLRFVAQLADAARDLPLAALNSLVSESVDLVVHCARGPRGPQIMEIAAVEDLAGGPGATQFTVTEVFERRGPDDALAWTGHVPSRLSRTLQRAGVDLRTLLDGQPANSAGRAA